MNTISIAMISFVGSSIIFVLACLIVRCARFPTGNDSEPDSLHGNRPERIANIRDQTERVHKAFEFYLKVTLAILGGIAYLVSSAKNGQSEATAELLVAAGWFELMIGTAFSVIVFLHMKSKIARWSRRYSWWEPFLWMECWFVAVMMTIAVSLPAAVIPAIVIVLPS